MNIDLSEFLGVAGEEGVRKPLGRCVECYLLVYPENWTLKGMAICGVLPACGQTELRLVCDQCVGGSACAKYYAKVARPGDQLGDIGTWGYSSPKCCDLKRTVTSACWGTAHQFFCLDQRFRMLTRFS